MSSTTPQQQPAGADVSELIAELHAAIKEGAGKLAEDCAEALARLQAERDDYLADVVKLDNVVAALGIEDSHEDPGEEIDRRLRQAERAEARVAELEAALSRIAKSDTDGSQDAAAPEMWLYCRETAHEALDRLGQQEKQT